MKKPIQSVRYSDDGQPNFDPLHVNNTTHREGKYCVFEILLKDTQFFKGIISFENQEMGYVKIDTSTDYIYNFSFDINHRLYHTPDPNGLFTHIWITVDNSHIEIQFVASIHHFLNPSIDM